MKDGRCPADAEILWHRGIRPPVWRGSVRYPALGPLSPPSRIAARSLGTTTTAPREGEAMERVVERAAGLDVHTKTVAACVRVPPETGERTQHIQTFDATTAGLLALRDWLLSHGVTHVAMESTGVYWKPVYYLLEDAFTCVLVNAAPIKQVPGRKT